MPYSEKITKVGAAERQLGTAIRLFFQREDLVAVHTLATAATQVLIDIGKTRGINSFIREDDIIRPEMKGEWIKRLNEAQNFFKHADKDPNGVLEFYPASTVYHIFEGVCMHSALTMGYSTETHVFAAWFCLKYPDLINEGEFKLAINAIPTQSFDPDDYETVWLAIQTLKSK